MNNYAISTADLAQSLTKSSGSLVAANGTLEEAVALTAAANTIIQDADVVGTALKTVAMRLRGTSVTEMEEEGLDTEGAVESKSKLQSKIKSLSGVNILTDTGAYKSTYEILSEISKVWEDINDMDQAALLELLAGKRAGSVMSAILQNPDVLKDAFESANDASGSALKENETYLDSIQGRIDLFTNSVQTMWQETLDSDFVKWIVDVGTELIKLITGFDVLGFKIGGLVPTIVVLGSVIMKIVKKMTWGEFFGSIGTSITGLNTKLTGLATRLGILKTTSEATQVATKRLTVGMLEEKLAAAGVSAENQRLILSKVGLDAANKEQVISSNATTMAALNEAVANKSLTAVQAFSTAQKLGLISVTKSLNGATTLRIAQLVGLTNAETISLGKTLGVIGATKHLTKEEIKAAVTKLALKDATKAQTLENLLLLASQGKLSASLKLLGIQIKEFIAKNTLLLAIAAIALTIWGVVEAFDALIVTLKESEETLSDLNSALSATESKLDDLEGQLKEVQDRMKELNEQPSLTFVEQEELDRLREQNNELERSIDITEQIRAGQQKAVNNQALKTAQQYESANFKAGKGKEEYMETGATIGTIAGGIIGGILAVALAPVTGGLSILVGAGGALAGGLVGGGAGVGIGAAVAEGQTQVDEAMDDMLEQRKKLEAEYNKAHEAYAKNPTKKSVIKEYEQAEEALANYDSMMSEHLSKLDSYYGSIDLSVYDPVLDKQKIEDLRKEMNDFYDTQDKWAIANGGQDAKSNAIARIFGNEASDELKEIKSSIEATLDAGGSVDFMDFEDAKYDAFKERLDGIGLSITDVIAYFESLKVEKDKAMEYDPFDTVKEIAKLEDGISGLKDAFDEFNESGAVTAATLIKLNEVFGNVEGWQKYVDVMSTGTASTEEAMKVTNDLAEALMHNILSNPFDFTNDDGTKNLDAFTSYLTAIQQLRSIGVTNAKELVDAKQQEAMVNQVVANIKRVQELESKTTLTDAEQAELNELKKNNYEEYAQVVEDAYGVEIKNTDLIRQQLELSTTQTELKKYKDFDNLHFTDANLDWTKYKDNAEQIGNLQEVVDGYNQTISEYENQGLWNQVGDEIGAFVDSFFVNSDGSQIENDVTRYSDAKDKIGGYVADIEEYKNESKKYFDELTAFANENGISLDGIDLSKFDASDISDNSIFKQVYDRVSQYIDDKQVELENLEAEIKAQLNTSFDSVGLEVILELQDKDKLVDDIQSIYDELSNAQKEYAENGYISVDTMQSLLKLEPKYLDMLVDENGDLNLTKETLHEVARARIVDLGLKQQNAIVDQALALAQQGSKQALDEWITVNENADESMKDSISTTKQLILATLKAREAAGELPKGYTDNFMGILENQLSAVQRVTDLALSDLDNTLSSSGNTAKAEEEDAFQKAMDYWENRIGANQARYEQIQNEIDLLETQGKTAGKEYYKEQIKLENERLKLLNQQKAEAKKFLGTFKEGSDEWWEVANTLNDIEGELDDVTASIVDLQDSIGEIDTYKFEEFNNRLDNLVSKLGTIRDLIAPDEENWFSDEGEWTEDGIAVLATYVQELEFYKQGLEEVQGTLADFNKIGNGAEWSELSKAQQDAYANQFGIRSEQEYYDKQEELISQQYDFAEKISDTEQSVVDMYESSIDAVEEYVDTLIDGYNDYIDSVKEALDAERDLYDFKKNVQKQAKDIAEIERRITSLSGSTNKADIAERRKLEAQLYESRESLNDTYYDHAKDAQNEALDAEQEAYETAMTKMVENMRVSLEEATTDMAAFLDSVTIAVSMNAETVLQKYRDTEVPLNDALTNPWEEAAKKVAGYGGDATTLMDVWKKDGYFAEFKSTATTNLSSPWSAGTTAAKSFKTSVSTVMSDVVSNIETNVQTASGELSKLYQQIIDTENRAVSANAVVNGALTGSSNTVITTTATLNSSGKKFTATKTGKNDSEAKKAAKDAVVQLAYEYYSNRGYDDAWLDKKWSTWNKSITYYAKGTTGTSSDEWAITDEPQFGDELVLVPTAQGNLSYMRKGTGVVPADLTANLMEWGRFTPDAMSLGGGVNVNMINNAVNKPEFNFTFDALVKAENITEETLPAVKKLVTQELNRFTKELNYALKGKGAR